MTALGVGSRLGVFVTGTLITLAACGEVAEVPNPPDPPVDPPDPPIPLIRERLDVAYDMPSDRQRFDLFLPQTGDGPFPVVLWLHGGGWISGDKQLAENAAQRRVVERGLALASVGYRLSPEATFPAQIYDVKAAANWLAASAEEYGLDPNRFAVWGASAGGHLAALLGMSAGVTALDPSTGATTSPTWRAVVDWFGPTDFLAMDQQAADRGCDPFGPGGHAAPTSPESRLMGFPIGDDPDSVQTANPVSYVTDDDPPVLIQHGTRDCLVALDQSLLLYDAIVAVSGEAHVAFDSLVAGHGGAPFFTATNIDRVLAFLEVNLGGS